VRYVLIPPHVRPSEYLLIWKVLFDHRLEPQAFETCAKHLFTEDQVAFLCAAILPDKAPIPAFEFDHRPYVMIELMSEHLASPRFLETSFGAIIEGSARIPLWESGTKINRPLRSAEHPKKHLRAFVISVRNPKIAIDIYRLFHNHEAEAA